MLSKVVFIVKMLVGRTTVHNNKTHQQSVPNVQPSRNRASNRMVQTEY